jgi:hypothetical protein
VKKTSVGEIFGGIKAKPPPTGDGRVHPTCIEAYRRALANKENTIASTMSAPMAYQTVVFQSRFLGGGVFFFFLRGGMFNSPTGFFERVTLWYCSIDIPSRKKCANRKKCAILDIIEKTQREA